MTLCFFGEGVFNCKHKQGGKINLRSSSPPNSPTPPSPVLMEGKQNKPLSSCSSLPRRDNTGLSARYHFVILLGGFAGGGFCVRSHPQRVSRFRTAGTDTKDSLTANRDMCQHCTLTKKTQTAIILENVQVYTHTHARAHIHPYASPTGTLNGPHSDLPACLAASTAAESS